MQERAHLEQILADLAEELSLDPENVHIDHMRLLKEEMEELQQELEALDD